ncbi:MAG: hypothetical protein AAF842_07370 [Planctomycetota bacterium]
MRTTWLPMLSLSPDLPRAVETHPGMISRNERQLLYTIALDVYQGWGRIVDAGAFLGASTACFATALQQRGFQFQKQGSGAVDRPILSFELGMPRENFYRHAKANGIELPPGGVESFLDYLKRLTLPYLEQVELREGNIMTYTGEGLGPVEVCFLDVLKTDQLVEHCHNVFFPKLKPGSLVIQQDYFFDQLPLIKVSQEALADHFDYIGEARSSAVYRLNKPLEMDSPGSVGFNLSPDEQLECHRLAESRTVDPDRQYMMQLSRAHLLAWHGRVEEARATWAAADERFASIAFDSIITRQYRQPLQWRIDALKLAIHYAENPEEAAEAGHPLAKTYRPAAATRLLEDA